MTPIGKALRAARKGVRVSQTATATHAGVSRPAISATERKDREPRAGELLRLASLFRLRPEHLLSGAVGIQPNGKTPGAAYRAHAGKRLDEQDEHELRRLEEALTRWSQPTTLPRLSDRLPITVARARIADALGEEEPFDIFRALYHAGVLLEFTALGTLSGALLRSSDGRCAVVVNSDQPDDRTRWSAAHEAAHIIYDHGLQEPSHVDEFGPARGWDDKIADRLAGELLVPTSQLLHALDEASNEHPGEAVAETVCRLAHRFCVSYSALAVRLGSAGALTGEQVAELRQEKPAELERELGFDTASGRQFDADEWIPNTAAALVSAGEIQRDWPRVFDIHEGPAIVRKLQAAAVRQYILAVPLSDRATSATVVLERVAVWVAVNHPLA